MNLLDNVCVELTATSSMSCQKELKKIVSQDTATQ